MKIYDEYGMTEPTVYLAILFSSALVFTLVLIIIMKRKYNWHSLCLGFLLGIPNQLTTKFFMKSLTLIPASVAYPLLASGVVLFAMLSDAVIWRRKFSGKALAAYGLLVLGIAFLNIKF
jgi:multidrug transporter EmrE-like cation transporter